MCFKYLIFLCLLFLLVECNNFQNGGGGCQDDTTETSTSRAIMLVSITLLFTIFLTYFFLKFEFKFIPESTATIFFGAILGLCLLLFGRNINDIFRLDPKFFMLVLLPPIIHDSGYTMQKGHFFDNLGSILAFAIFGTAITAFIIGLGLYLFRLLPFIESMMFGSLLAATDPVATLAIFQALNVDVTLHALVFGESILNDAISIVLFKTFESLKSADISFVVIYESIQHFTIIFFGSIAIGILFSVMSALVFKYIDFRKHSSLEITLMFIFSYLPYLISEALELSGILSILFCAVLNSQYTHHNLSEKSRSTASQTFHMFAYVAETLVFVYLGLAVFTFQHVFNFWLIFASILVMLVARACNVYPLSYLINPYRDVKIIPKFQFIMWFSGLRGAIAFCLCLQLQGPERDVLITTTLACVLFTILVLGGGTMPLLKFLNVGSGVVISRTNIHEQHESDVMASVVRLSELQLMIPNRMTWFESMDEKYLQPFFKVDAEVINRDRAMSRAAGHGTTTVPTDGNCRNESDNNLNHQGYNDNDKLSQHFEKQEKFVVKDEIHETSPSDPYITVDITATNENPNTQ